jgi:hypothetical protein
VGQKENAESLVQQAGRTMSAYQGTYCSFWPWPESRDAWFCL